MMIGRQKTYGVQLTEDEKKLLQQEAIARKTSQKRQGSGERGAGGRIGRMYKSHKLTFPVKSRKAGSQRI